MLTLVQRLGKNLSRDDPPHVVDRWLERAVEAAYSAGEKYYLVNLGMVAIQRSFRLSAPLLRGAWGALRGWRSMKPTRSRVPITRYRLALYVFCALVNCLVSSGVMSVCRSLRVGSRMVWAQLSSFDSQRQEEFGVNSSSSVPTQRRLGGFAGGFMVLRMAGRCSTFPVINLISALNPWLVI